MREPRDRSGPARKVSLRSRAGGVDCSAIARQRGGGGHTGGGGLLDGRVGRARSWRSCERAARCVNAAVLLVDKPAGPTSFGVRRARARRARRPPRRRSVTPARSTRSRPACWSLLVGRATRLAPYLVGLDKRYRTVVQLGVRSDTGDPEGALEPSDGPLPDRRGAGRRLRRGSSASRRRCRPRRPRSRSTASAPTRSRAPASTVDMPAREVHVHALDVISYDASLGLAVLDVRCSKGTYVRALARDLGETLGCGAVLRRAAAARDRAPAHRARRAARRDRGRSPRRRLAHALQRRARRTCPRASSAPAERDALLHGRAIAGHGEDGPPRCLADGRLVCVAGPRGDELRSLVVVDEA